MDKKLKLYYNKELLKSFSTDDELDAYMENYIKTVLNFKSYYYRVWYTLRKNKKVRVIDYGSHTNFFYVDGE